MSFPQQLPLLLWYPMVHTGTRWHNSTGQTAQTTYTYGTNRNPVTQPGTVTGADCLSAHVLSHE